MYFSNQCSIVRDYIKYYECFLLSNQKSKQGRDGSHETKVNRGAKYGLEIPCVYRLYGTRAYIERLKTAVEVIERQRN